MNTKIFEYILAIADEMNISRAAERCYLSQPMLSLHLKKIEEEYGTPLFERTSNGMKLTPAGIVFVNNARSILYKQSQLEKDLAALKHQKRTLHFFIDSPFYNYYLNSVHSTLQQMHPEYDIQALTATAQQAYRALKNSQVDAVVTTSDGSGFEDMSSIVTFHDTLVPVYPRDYPLKKKDFATLFSSELVPLLHPVGTTSRTIEEKALVAAGIFPEKILVTTSFHLTMHHIQNSNYCGFLPQSLYEKNAQLGIQSLPPVSTLDCVTFYRPSYDDDAEFVAVLKDLTEMLRQFVDRHD